MTSLATSFDIATNPLVQMAALPEFSKIRPEHVAPAIDYLLAQGQAVIDAVVAQTAEANWENVIEAIENGLEGLSRAWSAVGHLNGVCNTQQWRLAYETSLPGITDFYTALGQNLALFKRYQALENGPEFAKLDAAQQQMVRHAVRDFKLSGAELGDEIKPRYAEIQAQTAQLSNDFSNHVMDATDNWSKLVTDVAELKGLPDDVLAMFEAAATEKGQTGYLLSLHMPSYLPIMQYCENGALRAELYRAYVTRASELGPAEQDNTALIEQLLTLRHEEANLLGFETFADLSLATKMADHPTQVTDFLRDLARRAKPFAQQDLAELSAFASGTLGLATLEMWDVPYASEKLRQARYAFSEQEVKRYLPESKVLDGLFGLIQKLYGLTVVQTDAETWHPDVRFYSLVDVAGCTIGQFYLDLYARVGKRGGAWMDEARNRRWVEGVLQAPVAYLICNFTAPVGENEAYFSHDEVVTLFHECGHGLHHMLTEVDVPGVAGIHGVEWDAVELPSQFMENFCWEWDVFQTMTADADSGAPMPRALFGKMLAARNFQSGLGMVRQIEFSLFDMAIHAGFVPTATHTVHHVLDAIRQEVTVLVPPAFNRFAQSFGHIFGGGYAAGYYSYKWAEVLAADAFAAFEEEGVLNPETGARFRAQILAQGGSRPALESFVAFRGRAPTVDALLRHSGMQTAATA